MCSLFYIMWDSAIGIESLSKLSYCIVLYYRHNHFHIQLRLCVVDEMWQVTQDYSKQKMSWLLTIAQVNKLWIWVYDRVSLKLFMFSKLNLSPPTLGSFEFNFLNKNSSLLLPFIIHCSPFVQINSICTIKITKMMSF